MSDFGWTTLYCYYFKICFVRNIKWPLLAMCRKKKNRFLIRNTGRISIRIIFSTMKVITNIYFAFFFIDEIQNHDDVCAICYMDMTTTAKVTQCRHFFHSVCLKKWLYMQDTCPLCHAVLYKDSLCFILNIYILFRLSYI